MSRLAKIAVIVATAASLIAAKHVLPSLTPASATLPAEGFSVAPGDMMRSIGPIPQSVIQDEILG
jgi:hypothetical protein